MKKNEKTYIQTGDSVQITDKVNIFKDAFNVSGWTGDVTDSYLDDSGTALYYVRWDATSLNKITQSFIDFCDHEDLDWSGIALEVDNLTKVDLKISDVEREIQYAKLLYQYIWPKLGESGKRISNLFEQSNFNFDSAFEIWETAFAKQFSFPISTSIARHHQRNDLYPGKEIQIKGIAEYDETMGIWIEVEANKIRYLIPLLDIEIPNTGGKTEQLFTDYFVWWLNR